MKVFYNLALAGLVLFAAVPLVAIVTGLLGVLGFPLIAGALKSISPFSVFATSMAVVLLGLLWAVIPCTAYVMLSMQRAQLEAIQSLAQGARTSAKEQPLEHLPIVIGGIAL